MLYKKDVVLLECSNQGICNLPLGHRWCRIEGGTASYASSPLVGMSSCLALQCTAKELFSPVGDSAVGQATVGEHLLIAPVGRYSWNSPQRAFLAGPCAGSSAVGKISWLISIPLTPTYGWMPALGSTLLDVGESCKTDTGLTFSLV